MRSFPWRSASLFVLFFGCQTADPAYELDGSTPSLIPSVDASTQVVGDASTTHDAATSHPTDAGTSRPDASTSMPDAGPPLPPDVVADASTRLRTALSAHVSKIDSDLMIAQQPDLTWRPSRIYHGSDLIAAVDSMAKDGVGAMRLYLGTATDADAVATRYALVNLAAFLAQSMKETIRYDACDENNWDETNGYQISNSCGQLGQNYANYDCEMACPQDDTLAVTAVTHASWYGAPGPMFCAPDSTLTASGKMQNGRTGRWDYSSDCWPYPATNPNFSEPMTPAWQRADCEVYAGQKAGRYAWDGSGGSVQGCCWWGRGVIQTTGRCNFGMLNHYLGSGHLDSAAHPRPANVLYPDVNFCRDPESICSSTSHPELKWVAGLFYWMSSVQPYDQGGFRYVDRLRAFVDGGMTDDSFIDGVSGIVNRGCHNPPACGTGPLDGGDERRANFQKALAAFGLR